jgi:hypothetical protein
MNPCPLVLVTAMLAETAWAVRGMPQLPATGKTRAALPINEGGPKAPLKPFPRVSASRQGEIATKAIGGVGTAARTSATGSETPWAYALVPDTKHRSTRPAKTCRLHAIQLLLEKTDRKEGFEETLGEGLALGQGKAASEGDSFKLC